MDNVYETLHSFVDALYLMFIGFSEAISFITTFIY